MNEREMWQWFTLLPESERREIVQGISGCLSYGAVSMPARLPDAAKDAVRGAWAKHLVRVAELEALYPAD